MSCAAAPVNVTSLLNEVDTMLSGSETLLGDANAGSILTSALSGDATAPPEPTALFSTYLVSPAYFAETDELLLVKLVTAKGEPFYLLDSKKTSRPLVCGLTEVFLAPYNADTACVDECEGLPALHIVPECVLSKLFPNALRAVCTSRWFAGLVFVSSVGVQFYYRAPDCTPPDEPRMVNSVYRVAVDKEGHVEGREVRGSVTCDYPVPYLLVDESVFSEGSHSASIVESLTQANALLIDDLCRLEYASLHAAEPSPDDLDLTLKTFMGNHSHLVRDLLQAQMRGAGTLDGRTVCDDAFVRRQRKSEIDVLVRLMMREVELIGDLKHTLEELQYVEKAVRQCPQAPMVEADAACEIEEEEEGDPVLRPLLKITREEIAQRSQAAIGDTAAADDVLLMPMGDEDVCSPSSGSECSR